MNQFELIKSYYSSADCYFYPLARIGIQNLLRQIKPLTNCKVLVPAFICRDLLAPFTLEGFEILPYHITENFQIDFSSIFYDPSKPSLGKAIFFLINYFGFGQPAHQVEELAKNFIVFEDNAHGLFSKDSNGELLGTRGHFGILSPRKTLSLPQGGLILVNPHGRQIMNVLLSSSPFCKPRLKSLLREALRSSQSPHRPLWPVSLVWAKRRQGITGEELQSQSLPQEEYKIPQTQNTIEILNFTKSSMDFIATEVQRRRNLWSTFASLTTSWKLAQAQRELPIGISPYGLVLIFSPDIFMSIKEKILKYGIDIFPWPSLPSQLSHFRRSFYSQVHLLRFKW